VPALISIIAFLVSSLSFGISNSFSFFDSLLRFSCFSLFGVLIGLYISKFISGEKLKKIFGYFILSIAVFIFLKELY